MFMLLLTSIYEVTVTPSDMFDGLKLSLSTFTSSCIDLFQFQRVSALLMTGLYCRNCFSCLLMSQCCVFTIYDVRNLRWVGQVAQCLLTL